MITIANTTKDAARELTNKFDLKFSMETLNELAAMLQSDRFRHRTFILSQGELSNRLYFIARGLIRIYRPIKDQDDSIQEIEHEGGIIFLHQSLISHQASDFNIQTLEPTITYGLNYDELKQAATQSPEMSQLICAILEQTIEKQDRHHALLDLPPKQRYLEFLDQDPEVMRRTPLKYIASYLRMAPETLSRVRNALNR